MVTLTPSELKEIHTYLHEYIHTKEAQSMKDFCQHGAVSTYDHVMNVVRLSYFLNKKFLYDWHEEGDGSHKLHGFTHPKRALHNASRLFDLNHRERAIICQHMWPLTLRAVPSCRESVIVCLSDKISSAFETLFQRG